MSGPSSNPGAMTRGANALAPHYAPEPEADTEAEQAPARRKMW